MFTPRPLFSVGPGVLSKYLIGAKIFVMILLGVLTGYVMAVDLAEDAERGEALTMEEYVAGYDDYKADLIASEIPTAGAIIAGLIMIVGVLSIYEALSVALAWGISVVGRGYERPADDSADGRRSWYRD